MDEEDGPDLLMWGFGILVQALLTGMSSLSTKQDALHSTLRQLHSTVDVMQVAKMAVKRQKRLNTTK